jgi:hypothetical protein
VNIGFPASNGQNGWFVSSPVTGSISANDTTTGGSNITAINCTGATVGVITGLGTQSASAPLTVSGEGIHNVSCTATDSAGNSGAASGSVNMATVRIDSIAPKILITSPADGSTYLLNATVASSYGCADTTSGVATCAGSVASGTNFSASPVGAHAFTVTATDVAGNQAQATNRYSVVYNFSGFFTPVTNPSMINTAEAGSAIPVKFSLSGNQGLAIMAAGSPFSQNIACSLLGQNPTDPILTTVTAGASSLAYDPAADQYIYVWKTLSTWANSCRQLTVLLNDGTSHVAFFQFN